MWGRLGYPRRALRLHAAATAIVERHGGEVPTTYDELLALPGVGDVHGGARSPSFAYGRRHAVLDTNVRRVLARRARRRGLRRRRRRPRRAATGGRAAAGRRRRPRRLGGGVMELGALVCTARTPRCARCPVGACARGGWPAARRTTAAPARPAFAGTDRQVRGLLLAVLRDAHGPEHARGWRGWPDEAQRARALDGLVADGLVDPLPDGTFALPGHALVCATPPDREA